LELVSEAANEVFVSLDVRPPFKPIQQIITVPAEDKKPFVLEIDPQAVYKAVGFVGKPKSQQRTIQDILDAELQTAHIGSVLTLSVYTADTKEQPYNITYPIAIDIPAPRLTPRYTILEFPLTFRNREVLLHRKFENPTTKEVRYRLVHVPLRDVIGLNVKEFSLPELEMLTEMEKQFDQLAEHNKKLISAAKSTFQNLDNIFYDSLSKKFVIDQPDIFSFNIDEGKLPASGNKKPF